jgi:DNA-directed RNA polymerase specialized sigma24 family protein
MTPAMPVPQSEFTPYLLQQAGLRASLLRSNFGFAADDWDDFRQDLALDCLRRLPRFDCQRGNWHGFVRGVVRNQACVLALRQKRRTQFQHLDFPAGPDRPDTTSDDAKTDLRVADFSASLELGLDTQRVLASLPDDLRRIAQDLALMPLSAVRRKTGLTLAQLERRIVRIRAAFTAAGYGVGARGGNR